MTDEVKLLGCPFCGETPTIEPWHGGPKSKRMVHCENEGCWVNPKVCGNTPKQAADHWNTRAPAPREDGWRFDMENAPHDGTPLLVSVMINGPVVGEARWTGEDGDAGWWWAQTSPGDYYAEKITSTPIAWRPLPAPPSAREGE